MYDTGPQSFSLLVPEEESTRQGSVPEPGFPALPLTAPLCQILVLVSVPDINLLDYLPEILDGLFQILGDNGKEIRKM